ncbi:MAG: hypothetical protein H8E14_04710 [Candidatus Marinimicrobia bacterium]|nr:hypothetical protein [Candidatus Neomarinimicrobiota bacterium]
MKQIIKILLIVILGSGLASDLSAQLNTPAEYWDSLTDGEKLAFVNGAYTAISRMKSFHMEEVKKQYGHDPYWREPYFIERFYQILDQHLAEGVGYNIDIIAQAMNALYANFDNVRIPIVEALRIVSTAQDGDQQKANVLLLKAQRQYRPED